MKRANDVIANKSQTIGVFFSDEWKILYVFFFLPLAQFFLYVTDEKMEKKLRLWFFYLVFWDGFFFLLKYCVRVW